MDANVLGDVSFHRLTLSPRARLKARSILLHLLIKAVSIDKSQFKPDTCPSRASILKNCVPVSWVHSASPTAGLPSIAAVDVGLRTNISGLKAEFANREYADRIGLLIEADGILPPPEGFFSDLLHSSVLGCIQDDYHFEGFFCTPSTEVYWSVRGGSPSGDLIP
jgi:hypothetical protein